ncbi:elongation factor Ts [Candidatus Falkowbacteria bacterium]|nr:elongation factor Ts [Candidatus Falkowbacteria bacterium]
MSIDLKLISQLRETTGAGIAECQKALAESNGDVNAAIEILRKKGEAKAAKKTAERTTKDGIICAYIHGNAKLGVLLELLCETDFVAKTDAFKQLANDIAMHIAALAPEYVCREDVPNEVIEKEKIIEGKLNKFFEESCLLQQSFIKDETKTIENLIKEAIAKIGEKIEIGRFVRFKI